jgi:hypothetical protein
MQNAPLGHEGGTYAIRLPVLLVASRGHSDNSQDWATQLWKGPLSERRTAYPGLFAFTK